MNEDNMIIIIAISICLIIFYLIAEFIGRTKHIGRWWTFALLTSNLIIGIIALIVSPSSNHTHTKGTKAHKIWAWIAVILGFINIVRFNPFGIGFIVVGAYLYQISENEIINKLPRLNNITPPAFNRHYYFIVKNNEQLGPFTITELQKLKITDDTKVWREGLNEWKIAKDILELQKIIVKSPPPINF